jgi:hypothetical protein
MPDIFNDLLLPSLSHGAGGCNLDGVPEATHCDGHRLSMCQIQHARELLPRLVNMKRLQPIPSVAKDGSPETKICRSFDGYFHRFGSIGW